VDAAVAPLGILRRQSEDQRGGAFRESRSTGSAVPVAPAFGDEVSAPAQQGRRLDEEVSEAVAKEQSCESRQHRPACRLERWSVHLASKHRHLLAQHDDLGGEVRVTATDESDQLKHAAKRAVEEREGHGPGCSPRPGPAVKMQLTADGWHSRHPHASDRRNLGSRWVSAATTRGSTIVSSNSPAEAQSGQEPLAPRRTRQPYTSGAPVVSFNSHPGHRWVHGRPAEQ
jgi:hypothetical protein